jgi:sugar (pentulose or hexulose) kinase
VNNNNNNSNSNNLVHDEVKQSEEVTVVTSAIILDENNESLVLGLDCSTQSLTLCVYSVHKFKQLFQVCVNFAQELPHYKTDHGVYKKENNVVTAPTLMFIEALDIALQRLQLQKCPFSKVKLNI